MGQLTRSQDHNGYFQSFDYDAFGSLISVTDSSPATLFSATYDYGIGAFQRMLNDSDLGPRSYTYDALGELTSYTDNNSHSFSVTYDALARPLTRTEPDLTTTYVWGSSAVNHNLGRLDHVSATSSAGTYLDTYAYDGAGRQSNRTISMPSPTTIAYSYDTAYRSDTGLPDSLTYPLDATGNRLKLKYTYSANGILQNISDFNSPSTVYWAANSTNAAGQVTQETLGNGVVTQRTFNAVTGRLSTVQSGVSSGAALQNESYLSDAVGNVIQRQNNNVGLTENFFYDNLHRLEHSTLGGTTNLALTYAPNGNINTRSTLAGGATWTYGTSRQHPVTQAGSSAYAYTYDGNGNVTARNGYSIQWTSFDHPSVINGAGSESVQFAYNSEHERWRAIYSGAAGAETTYFIGGLLEKVVTIGGATDYRHFIKVGGSTVAIYSRTDAGVVTVRYMLEDHQGSVAGILNSDGTTYVKESFTAFGERRSQCTWSGPPTQGTKDKIAAVTRHGYTWQTALADMGLNDMNGRIQDAVTGRFLSADPHVPNSANTQSFNRYSYVNNNPLSYTDPSGFIPRRYRDLDQNGWDMIADQRYDRALHSYWFSQFLQETGGPGGGSSCITFACFGSRLLGGFQGALGPAFIERSQTYFARHGGGSASGGAGAASSAADTSESAASRRGYISIVCEPPSCRVATDEEVAALDAWEERLRTWSPPHEPPLEGVYPELYVIGFERAAVAGISRLLGASAVRAGSVAEAGALSDINALGGTMNCVACAREADLMLRGLPYGTAPLTGATSISELGTGWVSVSGEMEVGSLLSRAGSGSTGIVFGESLTGSAGHVWNAINNGGVINFIDAQAGGGGLMNFSSFRNFQFLLTSPP